jgi:DNA-binding transcriptional ArsR family regulator
LPTPPAETCSSGWVAAAQPSPSSPEPFGIALTGMQKHVRVLEAAELVTTEKLGRARRCRLGPARLDDVQEWTETYRRMLDVIQGSLVPVLLGQGIPFFQNLRHAPVELDDPTVIPGTRVTHLYYRVRGGS